MQFNIVTGVFIQYYMKILNKDFQYRELLVIYGISNLNKLLLKYTQIRCFLLYLKMVGLQILCFRKSA